MVDATLPYLNRHVRGLVEFQRLTGCRPGEACLVRRADIDTGGAVWLFKPALHKTAHRGKSRVIAIGPRAQALLRGFFTPNLEDYLFSPKQAVEEFHAERSAARVTPRYREPREEERRQTGRDAEAEAEGKVHDRVLRAGDRPGVRPGVPSPSDLGAAGRRE